MVDDEVKNVKLMEAVLVPRGYEIVKAYDGGQALENVEREVPDLILLDVMMPVMDGIEVCRKLKDDPETRLIPIVIMTALGQTEDRIRGIEAGADDFLTKPVNHDELLARISTSLRLKKTIEQKVGLLQNVRDQLEKFVPQSVKRIIDEHPDAPEMEKKEQDVSILFLDIVGYTKLGETLPQEQLNMIVESYFSSFMDCIHANGGDINETAGDGLMVIFSDDDPRRHALNAVKAGLEILQNTTPLSVKIQGAFSNISLHVGINSGKALVGPTKFEGSSGTRWTYTASGPVTNVAARIAAIGEGGTLLIGPETANRARGTFSLSEIGEKDLKNVEKPVMIFQVRDQLKVKVQ